MSDTNRLRALEMATGLAANGRLDASHVVEMATSFAAFLEGSE